MDQPPMPDQPFRQFARQPIIRRKANYRLLGKDSDGIISAVRMFWGRTVATVAALFFSVHYRPLKPSGFSESGR
jgi:hypothetical protein